MGAALGVLLWGVGWAGWLPILGADRAPWSYHNPKVLLPILDHAVYGTAWGLLFWALSRKDVRSRPAATSPLHEEDGTPVDPSS